jgi:Rad3-related DNA helicase
MVNRPVGMDPIVNGQRRWPPTIDGEEIRSLKARKPPEIDDDQWDIIRDTAAKVLCQCPNPNAHVAVERITGLALGKVQSGKTLSYTALIALGVDNGYRITVVLAGTKTPLLEQNYTRLCNDLEAANRPRLVAFTITG